MGDTPLLVRDWVMKCRKSHPDIKRGDPVAVLLTLPQPSACHVCALGLYEVRTLSDDTLHQVQGLEMNASCKLEVPFPEAVFQRPLPLLHDNPYFVEELEQYWVLQHWCAQESVRQMLAELFKHSVLRRDAVFLANESFRFAPPTDAAAAYIYPISARLMCFVNKAEPFGLRPEALALACLLEKNAATFCPELAACGTGEDLSTSPPLAILSHVLHIRHETFMLHARKAADEMKKTLLQLRLSVRKLREAGDLTQFHRKRLFIHQETTVIYVLLSVKIHNIIQSAAHSGLKSICYPATLLPCYPATLPAKSICYPATLLPSCCLAAEQQGSGVAG